MSKHMSYLQIASAVAHRSDMYHRHGAVVVDRKGRVLGMGFNYRVKNRGNRWSVHAEEAAIQDCRRKGFSLQHTTMYVIRIRTWKRGTHAAKKRKGCPSARQVFLVKRSFATHDRARIVDGLFEKNRLTRVFFTSTDL